MSQTETGPAPQPIIIVRRPAHHEDGHHGGAWKIAFADFMTAMMAFFLVMWLTNVTDEATRKQIAQYFSPIKLNSTSPDSPGLEEIEGQKPTQAPATPVQGVQEKGGDGRPVAGNTSGGKDEAIFRDPYAVLAEIAASDEVKSPAQGGVPDGSGLPGLNGGEAFRDPFDPASWQLQRNAVAANPAASLRPSEFTTIATDPARPPQPAEGANSNAAPQQVTSLETTVTEAEPAPAEAAAPQAAKAAEAKDAAEVAELKSEIAAKLPAAQNPGASGIEVSQGEGGITIALADSVNTGMFEVGSAKPRAETIRMMDAIAKILSERKGEIVIRGYTDARPYSGEAYDNWRLSTDRAHMAYYMLARGGLDEARVDSIEGFGDRKLKDPSDPFAAVNRRIEILLKEPTP